MAQRVRKAVLPVAGLGTRFLPATKAMAKEMLPVVDKPLIQYAIEEARAAGIEQFCLVTGRGKTAIVEHFDIAFELEATLRQRNKAAELAALREWQLPPGAMVTVRQQEPLGLGHAIWCARAFIGNDPFAILLPDDLVLSKTPCTKQLADAYYETGGCVVAVTEVPRDQTNRYGIVSGTAVNDQLTQLTGIVEKPAPANAPSTLAVAGRYVLTPRIFEELKTTPKGAGGEIQLTDAIAQLLRKEQVLAYRYQGTRYDCGSKLGFLQATVDLGQHHPQVGAEFSAWLAQRHA